jgi:hypothetical protein
MLVKIAKSTKGGCLINVNFARQLLVLISTKKMPNLRPILDHSHIILVIKGELRIGT